MLIPESTSDARRQVAQYLDERDTFKVSGRVRTEFGLAKADWAPASPDERRPAGPTRTHALLVWVGEHVVAEVVRGMTAAIYALDGQEATSRQAIAAAHAELWEDAAIRGAFAREAHLGGVEAWDAEREAEAAARREARLRAELPLSELVRVALEEGSPKIIRDARSSPYRKARKDDLDRELARWERELAPGVDDLVQAARLGTWHRREDAPPPPHLRDESLVTAFVRRSERRTVAAGTTKVLEGLLSRRGEVCIVQAYDVTLERGGRRARGFATVRADRKGEEFGEMTPVRPGDEVVVRQGGTVIRMKVTKTEIIRGQPIILVERA
jgi:hypothetical protein